MTMTPVVPPQQQKQVKKLIPQDIPKVSAVFVFVVFFLY